MVLNKRDCNSYMMKLNRNVCCIFQGKFLEFLGCASAPIQGLHVVIHGN